MAVALEDGEWSAARPCCTLSPGKTRYPLYRRLGGPQGWSGHLHMNKLKNYKHIAHSTESYSRFSKFS